MGLDWSFHRITLQQYDRLLAEPTREVLEEIHQDWFQKRYRNAFSLDEEITSFDDICSLGLRTFYDDLDTLMTWEGDDGPKLTWPLGDTGTRLPALGEMFNILSPAEVQHAAPLLKLLDEKYLEARFQFAEDSLEVPELFESELQVCFGDLSRFIDHVAAQKQALMWDYS